MVLAVTAYGSPVLRKISEDIDKNYPDLNVLIENMYETMYDSAGVGLAAPQVNLNIRLFVIDAGPYADEDEKAKDFKGVFINAQIIERTGDEEAFNEGCLSLPDIREDVVRKKKIRMKYLDADFKPHDKEFDGILARIIQHEYDHLEGKLFIDHIPNIRRMMLKRKLSEIASGKIKVSYKMRFPVMKKKKK